MNFNLTINKPSDNCINLALMGVYLFILLVSSIFFNSLNIWRFYRAKLFTPINIFMMTLLFLNLIESFIASPLIMYKSYNCKYKYALNIIF